jgi:hypothetical protein
MIELEPGKRNSHCSRTAGSVYDTCDLFCLFLSRVFSLSPQKSTNGGINKLESVIEVLTDRHQLRTS